MMRNYLYLAAAMLIATTALTQPSQAEEDKKFGNWLMTCELPQEGTPRACAAGQAVLSAETKKILLGWRWAFNARNALTATLRTRPGLQQDKGILIMFKPKDPSVVMFRECTAEFCETAFEVTSAQLAAALSANNIRVELFPVEGQTIRIKLATAGLKDALRALRTP